MISSQYSFTNMSVSKNLKGNVSPAQWRCIEINNEWVKCRVTVVELNTNQRVTAQQWTSSGVTNFWDPVGTLPTIQNVYSLFLCVPTFIREVPAFFSFLSFFTLRNSVSAWHISVRSSLHRHKRLQSSLYCFWLFCCPIIWVDAKLICGPLTFL